MLASQKGGVYMHRVRNLVGFLHIVLLVARFSDLAFDGRTVAGAFLHPPSAGGGWEGECYTPPGPADNTKPKRSGRRSLATRRFG